MSEVFALSLDSLGRFNKALSQIVSEENTKKD